MTNKAYPIQKRSGFGGSIILNEDGVARTLAPTAGGSLVSTLSGGGSSGTLAATENTDTMFVFGQPPSGTFSATEATDTILIEAARYQPDVLAIGESLYPLTGRGVITGTNLTDTAVNNSWNHIYARGNRLPTSLDSKGNGVISAVTVTLAGMTEATPFYTGFSGLTDTSGTGPYYGGTPTTASTFEWQMGQPTMITGLAFSAPSGAGLLNFGTWNVDASNDGSTWTNLAQFDWNLTSTGWHDGVNPGCTVEFTNDLAYTYYRLQFVSITGTFPGGRMASGIEFRIPADPLVADPTQVTVTTSMTMGNSRTVADLQDGLIFNGYPTPSPDQVAFNSPVTGDTITFDFGASWSVAILAFVLDQDPNSLQSMGTWKWQNSLDGTTWADSGSSFTLGSTTTRDNFYPGGAYGDDYRFWRLYCVTPPGSNVGGYFEIIFELESYRVNSLYAIENPDTASFRGYTGSYGVSGDMTPTEATDTATIVGNVTAVGSLSAKENSDIFSAYGRQPLSGVLAATEAPDTMQMTGLGRGENGTFTATENVDTIQISGYITDYGQLTATEAPDRALILGAGVTAPISRRRNFFVT